MQLHGERAFAFNFLVVFFSNIKAIKNPSQCINTPSIYVPVARLFGSFLKDCIETAETLFFML